MTETCAHNGRESTAGPHVLQAFLNGNWERESAETRGDAGSSDFSMEFDSKRALVASALFPQFPMSYGFLSLFPIQNHSNVSSLCDITTAKWHVSPCRFHDFDLLVFGSRVAVWRRLRMNPDLFASFAGPVHTPFGAVSFAFLSRKPRKLNQIEKKRKWSLFSPPTRISYC